MKALLVADVRSTFAQDWIRSVEETGIEVIVVASKGVPRPEPSMASHSGLKALTRAPTHAVHRLMRSESRLAQRVQASLRYTAGFVSVCLLAPRVRRAIKAHAPDVVHGMRIPFEGIAAAIATPKRLPLLISIWGNDIELHCSRSRLVRVATRRVLARCDGLHADAGKDLILARAMTLRSIVPTYEIPTSGGVRMEDLPLHISKAEAKAALGYGADDILVVNPRGVRAYIDTRTFVEVADEMVSSSAKRFNFVATGLSEVPRWSSDPLGRADPSVRRVATPLLSRTDLYRLLRAADIVVSPSTFDGLPNSIVEAMALGAVPVLSNLSGTSTLTDDPERSGRFDLRRPDTFRAELERVSSLDLGAVAAVTERLIAQNYSADRTRANLSALYTTRRQHSAAG